MAATWAGALAYTLQIAFDFGGYSTMAIGLGHMMGFSFPANFDRPYTAQSVTDFWHRWHMTLSRWFRDYLYIPLGGNRHGALRTYANLVTVFLLCGLWHGAAWNFVAWGAWHGLFLVLERAGLLVWPGRMRCSSRCRARRRSMPASFRPGWRGSASGRRWRRG